MSSGVSVADECLDVYKEMQMGHKFRYIIYSLNPAQDTIIVERIRGKGEENSRASPEEKYADFLQLLAAKKDKGDCCYAVYDAEYKKRNGHDRSKIVFLVWCPDAAVIKKKMLYASSKDHLRKKMVGIHAEVQGTEIDEVQWEAILEKLDRHETSS